MPGKKDQSQQRTTAAFKMKVLAEMEALVAGGMSMTAASKAVAAKYEAAAGDQPKPFSERSAQGWLEKKAEIAEQASQEPAGGDAVHARPEQAADRALPTKEHLVLQQRRYEESEEGKEERIASNRRHHRADREDKLRRDQISASLEEDMPIPEIWRVSRAAAEYLFKLYLEEHARLQRLGRHAAAYTGLATGRTFGGCRPGDGERVVYGQGTLDHAAEEFRHWCAGDSLQSTDGGGLPLAWCRENVKVLAVELPNKVCLKVTEMWLHTLIFRHIRSGKMRSLIYQPLPDASYAGLLACETLISAGTTDIPGKGVVFLTFVEGALDLIRESALEVKQGRLGRNLPGDVDVEGMQERAADWEERDARVSEASFEATAPPPAARGDHLHVVLESDTNDRVMSEHGNHWEAKVDDEPWEVDGRRRGWVLTICYGSGRGALRGKVRGRGARTTNLLCSSLEVAVREAWKQADAKLHQGRSDRCGPDSKVDQYDLVMAPRRPAAPEPAGKRARLK